MAAIEAASLASTQRAPRMRWAWLNVQAGAKVAVEGLDRGEGEGIVDQRKIEPARALRHEHQHGRRLGQDAANR